MAKNKTRAAKKKKKKKGSSKLYEVRHSPIHGYGVFAQKKIKKGVRVIEYKGERISQAEADARYNDVDNEHAHIVLFAVDDDTVIDGKSKGNDGRYVNHSCDPNCEAVNYDGRIWIYSLRKIEKGEELFYDYSLELDEEFDKEHSHLYACHCGAKNCRGVMLAASD
ncbi:MAG: SET domain-containing protein-lysine N-methyltransferase [Rhodothermales bacterium]|nr:SET domain-containing protein-lysine N-methyltransferase [Rhodothermales bacterium]